MYVAAVIAALSACVIEAPPDDAYVEQPVGDESAEMTAYQQQSELAAISEVEEVYETEQVSYAACMLACAGGTTAIEIFCRRIVEPLSRRLAGVMRGAAVRHAKTSATTTSGNEICPHTSRLP